MEIKILDMIQNLHTTVGDHLFIGITKLGDAGIIWIFLTILLLILPKMRKYGLAMLVGLCIDVIVCNGLLKNLVARTRPCDVNTAIQLLISHPTDYSFPSGHTAASFTAVAALYFSGDKKIWKAVSNKTAKSYQIIDDCILLYCCQHTKWNRYYKRQHNRHNCQQ